jgi:pimeloyl-ACP methyl ester carboxylesterase
VLTVYPGYYLSRLGRRRAPDPLPEGQIGALLVPGMFAVLRIYGRLMHRIRARGVPVSGLDFGSNMWGSLDDRVAALRAAVDAHAKSGGRVVLVAHSMGTLVCARFLLEKSPAVVGFVSICGVFGGLKRWTLLGWPLFRVVREMMNETGSRLPAGIREMLRNPAVPTTVFQGDMDEFVRDQSEIADVVRFRTSVTHNGPIRKHRALDTISERVAEYAALVPSVPAR